MKLTQCLQHIDESARQIHAANPVIANWVRTYVGRHRYRLAQDLRMTQQFGGRDARILEYGSSPPLLTLALMRLGCDVQGVDIAPERFSETIRDRSLAIHKVDFENENVPFADASFDIVLFNEVFEHLRINPINTMTDVRRVLKPHGTLLLSTPNIRSLRGIWALTWRQASCHAAADLYDEYDKMAQFGHMGHVREYTAREVSRLLARIGLITKEIIFRNDDPPQRRSLGTWICHRAERLTCALVPSWNPQFSLVCEKNDR